MKQTILRLIGFPAAGVLLSACMALSGHACTPSAQHTAVSITSAVAGLGCTVLPVFVNNAGSDGALAGAICEDAAGLVTGILNGIINKHKAALVAVKPEDAKYAPIKIHGRTVGVVRAELAAAVQKDLDALDLDGGK